MLFKNWKQIERALAYYSEASILGQKNNPVIVQFFKNSLNPQIKNDDVAWCAAFVNSILYECKLPQTGKLNARSFLNLGVKVDQPVLGDIVVLWRISKDGPWGHVGFFIREEDDLIYILGGNQDNEVNIKAYNRKYLLEYRSIIIE
jgi:uncharacterized protein (TIGR02594 family)